MSKSKIQKKKEIISKKQQKLIEIILKHIEYNLKKKDAALK